MANYSGYFMQGFASGLPNLASQISTIKLKNEQKKEAEKLKDLLSEAIISFTNNNKDELDLIAPTPEANTNINWGGGNDVGASMPNYNSSPSGDLQYGKGMGYNELMGNLPKIGSEGVLANPKLLTLITTISAMKESLGEVFKDIVIQIDRGNIAKYEQDMDYAKNMINRIAELNLAGADVNSYYGFENLFTPEGQKYIQQAATYKNTPSSKMPSSMVGAMAETSGFPQSVADEANKIPPEGYGTPLSAKDNLIIESYKKGAISYDNLLKYLDAYIEPEKLTEFQIKFNKAVELGATNEELKNMIVGKASTTATEELRTTSLPQLEEYRDKALNADTWEDAQKIINDYTNAGYDSTQLGVTKEEWVNIKKSDLDNLMSVLNEITAGTPEGQNIKGKKEFTFNINDKDKTQTGEEWYKQIYDSYVALLKLLEEQGVDTSQYKKLKPLSEIKKANVLGGMFTGKGVEKGDLIKIYY